MFRPGNPGSANLLAGTTQSAFFCFATGNVEPRPRKRAKFGPKRREEVKKVRKRGACLRCRLLKITCSDEEGPCASCMKLALATSKALERKVLRWTDCIRTLLTDVKFFDEAIPPEMSQHPIKALEAVLAATPVTLEFASQITWEIDSFSNDIWKWLSSREVASTSKVGAMSSLEFRNLIKPLVGHDISTTFRLMIYAISLAHTQQSSDHEYPLSVPDLQKIGALAGKRCLKFLDNTLTASSLTKIFKERNAKEKLQALFLLAFGTILAIGYAKPVTESPVFPVHEDSTNQSELSQIKTLHRAMQTHLCRTLAHHVVYLGTRLDLPISSTMEQFILDTAESMWNKEGHFSWKTTNVKHDANEEDEQPDEPSSNCDYLNLDVDKWPVYLTEAYYNGDSCGPQESGSFSDDAHQEFPVSYLPVIEDIGILAHMDHGEGLNTPYPEMGCECHSGTVWPSLPLNVPEPHLVTFVSCDSASSEWQYVSPWPLAFVPNWLLV